MKKLKVAIVIPTHFDIHSSLNNLLKVYRYLIKNRNIEVTIFTDKRNDINYGDFVIEKISRIGYKTIFEKILFVLGMPRYYYTDLIDKLKGYDVIESSNPEFYWFAYQSYIAAKKYNSKLIYRTSQTVDGFYLFKITKFIPISIAKKAYDYAKWLLFTNPEAAERCVRLRLIDKNSRKIVLIGHATDTKTFRPLGLKKDKNKTILLSVGGLYKIKGHHLIIQALKKIIEKGHNAELWIVGEGYYRDSLTGLAKELNLEKNIKFLGSKGHGELAFIYNKADIFVLANYQEVTPAVNEALACQKPVVVMKTGGYDFVVPNKNYGLITKRFDVEDMADKIIFLIENPEIAGRMARNGRERILKNFSIEKVGFKMYKAFIR